MGTFTERSDIDLVVVGAGTTDRHWLANLQDLIIESDFPYLCDLHYVEMISNPQLLAHIQRTGRVLYECPE
jgi:predicted nucleotidyltransferase